MKRLVALAAAVLCCASSAFAWDSESFIADSDDYYGFQSVMLMSLDDGVSLTAASSDTDSENLLYSSTDFVYTAAIDRPYKWKVSGSSDVVTMPDTKFWDSVSPSSSTVEPGYHYNWCFDSQSWSAHDGVVEYYSCRDYFAPTFSFIVPLGQECDICELNFYFTSVQNQYYYDSSWHQYKSYADSLTITAAGSPIATFENGSGTFSSESLIVNPGSSFDSVTFSFTFSTQLLDLSDLESFSVTPRVYANASSFVKVSFLSGTDVLNGYNDNAQQSINDHEAIESQWTGSMTSNFDALDPESFTYPDGLISGFSLITGIFNDLWNGMGEFKILYVFPLTLGIMLLVIGKLSKFAGHGSSARKSGDDGA